MLAPMRTITTSDQDLLLEVSPLDREEVDNFTAGDCWMLAYELHNRGVGELIAVVDKDDPDAWCHMAVELEDGTILDANGLQNRVSFLRRWGSFVSDEPAIARYDLTDPRRWTELTGDQDPYYSTAEEVAEVAERLADWIEEL